MADWDFIMTPEWEWTAPKCIFPHEAKAVVIMGFDHGCHCFPNDNEQPLCAQHANDTSPIGTAWVILKIDPTWPDGWKSAAQS